MGNRSVFAVLFGIVLLLVIPLSIDGSVFADDDDGTGEIKAENFNDLINKKANNYIKKDTQLKWDMIDKN